MNEAKSLEGGHAVLLIGWDDWKQAFLCKNSWGNGGPNGDGTFWIAYSGHANNLGFGMANFSVTSSTCSSNAECDDGIACNGQEICVSSICQQGTPVDCPDDGLFCNGSEYCEESSVDCASTNDACETNEECIEEGDICKPETCGTNDVVNVCEEGEDCMNCWEDCISGPGGGTCEACFKGTCDGSCHPVKENSDCTDCAPSWCCGDGVCNGGEDSDNCALDCGQQPSCLVKKEACSENQECCSLKCVRGICR